MITLKIHTIICKKLVSIGSLLFVKQRKCKHVCFKITITYTIKYRENFKFNYNILEKNLFFYSFYPWLLKKNSLYRVWIIRLYLVLYVVLIQRNSYSSIFACGELWYVFYDFSLFHGSNLQSLWHFAKRQFWCFFLEN